MAQELHLHCRSAMNRKTISLILILGIMTLSLLVLELGKFLGSSVPTINDEMINNLPDYGPAPEIKNEVWLNTESTLTPDDLLRKVILLDMWTFG